MKYLEKILIKKKITVKEALRLMDDAGEKVLFFVDEDNTLLGSLTDGDIRRFILKEGQLSEFVDQVYKKTPLTILAPVNHDEARELMTRRKVEALPVVDIQNRVVDVLLWTRIFQEEPTERQPIESDVLIMAGGKGTRLDPFTRILPKPLIPFGDKPIVEIIMDNFAEYGCKHFHLTVNHKGKMIQSYFDSAECDYTINCIWEETFCGTAGSIKLAQDQLKTPDIFVSNCDILIKADYADILKFHRAEKNDITVIGSMQHVSIPYGVIEMKNGGTLTNIIEKPEYDFFVNTGFYVMKKDMIRHIPEGVKFDFPDLILKVKKEGCRVGVYPISQQSWVDIGQWQEYQGALKKLEANS